MEKKMLLLLMGAALILGTIFCSLSPAASPEEQKHMWTVTGKCTQKGTTVTQTHCGKKGEAVEIVKGQLRRERGCQGVEIVSAEKGEKCN
jgi:hypothetical protein